MARWLDRMARPEEPQALARRMRIDRLWSMVIFVPILAGVAIVREPWAMVAAMSASVALAVIGGRHVERSRRETDRAPRHFSKSFIDDPK